MRRRLVILLLAALLATGCDYREILRVNADGSAILQLEVDLDRADVDSSLWPFLEWETAEELEVEFSAPGDEGAAAFRRFLVELFALEAPEPWMDDAVEGFVFRVDDERLHMAFDLEIDDLASIDDTEPAAPRWSLALADAIVERADDGTMRLSAPTRENAAELIGGWFALDDDPFVERENIGADDVPLSFSVEIGLPGAVRSSDAHAIDGNTHTWTWEFGRTGEPGIDVAWDPTGGDDGCELCGAFAPIIITIAILGGLLLIGVLAASLGLLEAWWVTRRDRRNVGRPDDAP